MANRFQRVSLDGGDSGVWGPIEEAINLLSLGTLTSYLYDDAGALKLSKGRIGLDDGSQKGAVIIDTVATLSLVGLTVSEWAKIEVSRTGTVITLAITSIAGASDPATLPASFTGAYDGDKQGYYITATKRVLGLAWINAGGTLEGIINCGQGSVYNGYSTSDDAFDVIKYFLFPKQTITPYNQSRLTYTKNAAFTVETFTGYQQREATYHCTAGTNGWRATIPATGWQAGDRLVFIKSDSTNSAITLTGVTMSGLTYLFLIHQWQKITLEYNGTAFVIVQGVLIADSGYINTADWTNRHLGTADITFDNKSVTDFEIGELVKEDTSLNTGIIVNITATVLTIWRVTGTGLWTNDRVITGQKTGTTADVNTPDAHATTKDDDTNFYHGFAKNVGELTVTGIISPATTGLDSSSFQMGNTGGSGSNFGYNLYQIDTNNFKIQTSEFGLIVFADDGSGNAVNTDNWSYRFIAKLTI